MPVELFANPFDPGDFMNQDPSYAEFMTACRELSDPIYDFGSPASYVFDCSSLDKETLTLSSGDVQNLVHTPAGPLSEIHRAGARGVLKRFITEPADVEKWLSIPQNDCLSYLNVEEVQGQYGQKLALQVTTNDAAGWLGVIAEETLAIWTVTERALVREFLDECQRRVLRQITELLTAPVDIIYFNGPEYCIPPLMSPRDFEEFVFHYDREVFSYLRQHSDKLIIVHCHGKVRQFLMRFRDMGLHGLNVLEPPPVGDTDLGEAKELIGGEVCLIGNIQYDDLARATPGQVQALVREAMDKGKPGGGYILSLCAKPYEQPLPELMSRNLILLLEFARELGAY